MGLINNDMFEASNGVQKTGTYISFSNEMIYIQKNNEGSYTVIGYYRIFWDKDARLANKAHIDTATVIAKIPDTDLNNNLYTVLYNEIKTKFTNTIDDL
jgi:hypothetical protein